MNYKFSNNNINVLYKSGPAENGRLGVITEIVDKTEVTNFSKVLLEKFLNTKNKIEALEYLKRTKEGLAKMVKLAPGLQKECIIKINTLEQWAMGKGIFDAKGAKIGDIKKETLKQITGSLGLTDSIAPTANSSEKQKSIDEFKKKNPIEKYKKEILDYCIKHPQISEHGNYLAKKQNEIIKLGIVNFPEYNAILGSLLNIVHSKEFDENTGFFSKISLKAQGKGGEVKVFEEKLSNLLDIAIKDKKIVDLSSIDENRALNEGEKKSIKDYVDAVKVEISKMEGNTSKLAKIDHYIQKAEANPNGARSQIITEIRNKLTFERHAINESKDSDLGSSIKDTLKSTFTNRKDTDENSKKSQEEARALTEKTGIVHFPYFDASQDKYVIKSIKEISNILSTNINDSKNGINAGLFKSIISNPAWKQFFITNMSPEAIAAIGAYIKNKPDTALFKGNESAMPFFINAYDTTITEQTSVLTMKKINELPGSFVELFPTLNDNKNFNNDPDIQSALKSGKMDIVYQKLVSKGLMNGEIKNIMRAINIDIRNLKERTQKEVIVISKNFQGKMLSEFENQFNLTKYPDSKEKFAQLKTKKIQNGTLTEEDRNFLISSLNNRDNTSPLSKFLKGISLINTAGKIQGESSRLAQVSSKKPKTEKAIILTPEQVTSVYNAGKMGSTLAVEKTNSDLGNANSNISGIEKLNTIESIGKELNRLSKIEKPTQGDIDKIDILRKRLDGIGKIATTTNNFVKSPGVSKEDAIGFVREITGTKSSDVEIRGWIESQEYISKYVTEKNFVENIEKNAAGMNRGETKSIQDLYSPNGKVDISNMSQNSGSIKISDSNIANSTSFQGMNELMNCKIEIGEGSSLTRTIRSPEGVVIASNIPLDNIEGTIQQLGRFYAIGLGKLAPYITEIGTMISRVRPDSISGLDGKFTIDEDKKFLKIIAIMLYGKENLPTDDNIPNLIRLFNSSDTSKHPGIIMERLNILPKTGGVNSIQLEEKLQAASKQV